MIGLNDATESNFKFGTIKLRTRSTFSRLSICYDVCRHFKA